MSNQEETGFQEFKGMLFVVVLVFLGLVLVGMTFAHFEETNVGQNDHYDYEGVKRIEPQP